MYSYLLINNPHDHDIIACLGKKKIFKRNNHIPCSIQDKLSFIRHHVADENMHTFYREWGLRHMVSISVSSHPYQQSSKANVTIMCDMWKYRQHACTSEWNYKLWTVYDDLPEEFLCMHYKVVEVSAYHPQGEM